jgi:NADH-quinone oxidoreductase subunit C
MNELIERLRSKFNARDMHKNKTGHVFLTVEKKDIEGCVLYLKEFEGYGHLNFISAVDWIEKDMLELVYHLHNFAHRTDVSIKTFIDRKTPSMVSINNLWAGAKVYEREIREMFGIDFPGCPRVEEPFALEGWKGMPPMRKEFDTKKYSEETYFPRPGRYTKDNVAHMEEKMYSVEAEVKKGIAKTVRKNKSGE